MRILFVICLIFIIVGLVKLNNYCNKKADEKRERYLDLKELECFGKIDYDSQESVKYVKFVKNLIEGTNIPNVGEMCCLPNGVTIKYGKNYDYYIYYHFLRKVLSNDAASFITGLKFWGEDDGLLYRAENGCKEWQKNVCDKFLKEWQLENVLDSDDFLNKYFRSSEFEDPSIHGDNEIERADCLEGLYNLYKDNKFELDDLEEESVIYSPVFICSCGLGENFGEVGLYYLNIYHGLKSNPKLREEIMFEHLSGGRRSLRLPDQISEKWENIKASEHIKD